MQSYLSLQAQTDSFCRIYGGTYRQKGGGGAHGPSNAPMKQQKSLKHRLCIQWGQDTGTQVTGCKPSPQRALGLASKNYLAGGRKQTMHLNRRGGGSHVRSEPTSQGQLDN